jgi:plastocyanin
MGDQPQLPQEAKPMKRSFIACIALVVSLVVLAPNAGARGDHTTGTTQRVRVRIVDNRYRPASITIDRGTVVKWVNRGNNTHTSTSNSWDSGRISPGDSFKKKFRRRGTFSYHCTIHATMMGTITVT